MHITNRFPALASRDFLIFWVGQFISVIGTWMQNTILPYLAYRLTGSPFDLGLIGFATTLPTLLLALPGGVLVERLDKRKAVILLQSVMMIQAFLLGILTLSGHIQIWHIASLAFLLGSATAIEITARQSMLVELVGKPALPNAIALQTTIFNLGRVLGPTLGAVVLVMVENQGEGWAFLLNGTSFLFVIIGLLFVRTPYKAASAFGDRRETMLAQFMQGQKYVLTNATVGMIILLAALVGFFGFPFSQQIPALARDVLAQAGDTETIIKARNSALYMAQGIGALMASLIISTFSNLKRKGLLLVIGEVVFASALLLIALTRNLAGTLGLIGLLGWALITQLAMMNTLIQIDVPDALRGRVFSIYLWAIQGVAPFGSLFVGWLAQSQGVPRAALVCGILCLLAVIAIHTRKPILLTHLS
ncbi:MAG: MFS transporter [Anaerolineales bacterium]|nr:MFS transporter [Anaerolineales bacterium]